jgi:membrane protease YdiL (CAAX protease family)
MSADSRRALFIFFSLVILLCGFFDFFAIHYSAGTRSVMWCVGLSAMLTLWITKRDLKTLGWGWGAWRYQWLAFLIPAAYTLVAYLIVWSAGLGGFYDAHFVAQVRDSYGLKDWSDWAVIGYFVAVTASFGLSGSMANALGEEIGWRGFLVPELAKSMSFTSVALLSGVIWAVWHLPLILLGNYHNNSPAALALGYQLLMFCIIVISAAVIMAYLRLKSGSLWTGAIFHASHNLFIQAIFNPLTIQYPDTPKFVDELGIVPPLVALPVGIYFLIKGRREFASPGA